MTRRRPRWKTLCIRLALPVAVLLVGLLAVEVVFRIALDPPRYREQSRFHPTLGFSGIPNLSLERTDARGTYTFALNSRGFRGPELPASGEPAPEGTKRLLFIGDSFLKAWTVREEERIPEVVAASLNSAGRKTEQFCLCEEGYGTAQELLLWRMFGRDLSPDLVVLVFYSGNDPSNNTLSLAGLTAGDNDYTRPYLVPDGEGGLETRYLHPVRAFFRRHLWSFAYAELELIRRHEAGLFFGIDARAGQPADAGGAKPRDPLPNPGLNLFRPDPPDARYLEAWETTEALLARFRDEVEAAGSRLLVVVVPERIQLQRDARSIQYDLKLGGRFDELFDLELPERRLHAFFRREGMSAILPLEAMRDALRRGATDLFGEDNHLLAAGHAIIAQRIMAWIADYSIADLLWQMGSNGAIHPREHEPTEPVRVLEKLDTGRGLTSFREDDRLELISGGDGHWLPRWPAADGGWAVTRRLNLIVPAVGAGDLFLRGFVPEGWACPFELTLTVDGKDLSPRARVDAPGVFQLRFASTGLPSVEPEFRTLRIAVSLLPEARAWTDRRCFVLQEVGFE